MTYPTPHPTWRNRQMLAAYWKGDTAARTGGRREDCPYQDLDKHGNVTFSRAFRNAWLQGYDEATWDDEEAAP